MTETSPESVGVCVDVCVYVCTYRRNEALARLLDSLQVAAKAASPAARLAVVVVDDNPDRGAEQVVAESAAVFPLGLHYRFVGAGNIAIARNAGLEAAMALAPWVAMVDDDQVVVPEWLSELLRVQREHDADAVTAPVYARFGADAPDWIRDQPFADLWCTPVKADGASVTDLQTANSLISTEFLEANPEVRFAADLGEAGGEDMVFYRMALDAGLKAHYSHHAVNWEIEPRERATYRYQLRRNLWHGNTEAVTNLRAGRDSRVRLLARAAKRGVVAAGHPIRQRRAGDPPEWRYTFAYSLQSVGMILGAAGVVLRHG
ncbi:MAG: glycosyltransferase family 2 protein [Acidimicrobiales bacterium]